MTRTILLLILALALATAMSAQNNGAQSNASQDRAPQSTQPHAAPSQPAAEDDISGMYTFLKDGEFVQVNVEDNGQVTGFVSRYGDDENDKGTFLDQFFSKGELKGNALTFTTKPIHNVWFEFSGTVARGSGKTPQDEAYRVIKGKLIRYRGAAAQGGKPTAESRELEMKSFPADMDERQ